MVREVMKEITPRQRLFVIASVLYILIGVVIFGRSVVAHVLPVAVLGIVFIALGMVRLRDFVRQVGAR